MLLYNYLFSYWLFSFLRVVVDDGLAVEHEEDPVSRQLGLGEIGGKGAGLANGSSSKHNGYEDTEHVKEGNVGNMVSGLGHQECTEPEHGSVQVEDSALGQAVGDGVHQQVVPRTPAIWDK